MTFCTGTLVLAYDLSLAATGVCFPDGSCDTLTPPAGMDDPTRLAWFGESFDVHLADWNPDRIVYETPFVGRFPGTAIALSKLHGVLLDRIGRSRCVWTAVAPASLKFKATGNGQATKADMVAAAFQRGADVANDNEADAWLLYLGAHAGWWS